jgi:hypothetical protein
LTSPPRHLRDPQRHARVATICSGAFILGPNRKRRSNVVAIRPSSAERLASGRGHDTDIQWAARCGATATCGTTRLGPQRGKPLFPRRLTQPPLTLVSVRQVGSGFAELRGTARRCDRRRRTTSLSSPHFGATAAARRLSSAREPERRWGIA